MADDEKKRLTLEQLQARMQEYAERDRSSLQAVGFDWRKSPAVDHGADAGNPLDDPPTLAITLRDGRVIKLRELYQYYVYDGALAGYPPNPEWQLIGAMEAAAHHFQEIGTRPVMLEPTFHSGTATIKVRNEPQPWPWVTVPGICSIARFDSGELAREGSACYSSLVVIWFQDTYGLLDDARTLAQIRNLDWEAHAADWAP